MFIHFLIILRELCNNLFTNAQFLILTSFKRSIADRSIVKMKEGKNGSNQK